MNIGYIIAYKGALPVLNYIQLNLTMFPKNLNRVNILWYTKKIKKKTIA